MSTSRPHEQKGFRVSWKLCLNLCSRKWLRPRRSLVMYFVFFQLWQLNTLFRDGLINFNKFFLETLRPAVLRGLGFKLFHSITVDGKKRIFEKVIFSLKKSNFFWYCNLNFLLVLDWKGKLVYLFWKSYKISKVFCTIADVGKIQA